MKFWFAGKNGSQGSLDVLSLYLWGTQGAVCVEKNASSLRAYPPWKAWVQTIRSYGNQASNYLSAKPDALILAQAMEDNGCGFLANLSAQNISLGGCFSWNSTFSWDFKTLEVFCPVTCGCGSDSPRGSGCPTPFGYTCSGGEVQGCLTWDGKHFCEGFNAEVLRADILFSIVDFLMAQTDLVSSVLFITFLPEMSFVFKSHEAYGLVSSV